ncbi:hypothetical protein [Algoriphagus pacificus]|uniref:Uncharacterized protein n=1 Tax=Algoriphagus pacificus TaxID=2811234 RepID=A0ABS3CL27_9BACT|nr:hypothetical protein [Algoriphagus pacificus]MBN7817777.1 hypothetical protein [Algoriphagus pacificus]
MITKKDIPLDLLKTIEPIAQANLDLIQFKREDNTFYCFVENDSNSKNFFKIFIDGSKRIGNYDKSKYGFEFKPASASIAKHRVSQTNSNELGEQFQNWINLIRDIHEIPSVHDDNFVRQYAEFYYNEFKIVDEDADISPFDPNQQDLVEVYLLSLSSAIEQSSDKLSDAVKNELIYDIQIIQAALPTTTKGQVMKGITKVFGKLYKTSKTLAKDIVAEARKYLIKKLIELGIEYGPRLLEMFNKD